MSQTSPVHDSGYGGDPGRVQERRTDLPDNTPPYERERQQMKILDEWFTLSTIARTTRKLSALKRLADSYRLTDEDWERSPPVAYRNITRNGSL